MSSTTGGVSKEEECISASDLEAEAYRQAFADEQAAFANVVTAYRSYRKDAERRINRAERDWYRLSKWQRDILPVAKKKFVELRRSAIQNQEFIDLMIQPSHIFENRTGYLSDEERTERSRSGESCNAQNGSNAAARECFDSDIHMAPQQPGAASEKPSHAHVLESELCSGSSDMEKVRSTLRQFVREWAEEGDTERQQCFQPIISEIMTRFSLPVEKRGAVKVLVPGAGLGRLPWELAHLGYSAQGNEFSFFMLIPSSFILNRSGDRKFTIYPYIHSSSNNMSTSHQLQAVSVPDVTVASIPATADFSMCAGEFVEVYREAVESFDCVATCFFIDTAPNVIDYIETITRILKPGGVWINLGPLLYHYEDVPKEHSIELSWDEIRQVIEFFKLRIEKVQTHHKCYYTSNSNSMMQVEYNCVFFVAIKD